MGHMGRDEVVVCAVMAVVVLAIMAVVADFVVAVVEIRT